MFRSLQTGFLFSPTWVTQAVISSPNFFFQPFFATSSGCNAGSGFAGGNRFLPPPRCRVYRICASRCNRHVRGGNWWRYCHSLCCVGRYCGLGGAIGVPVVCLRIRRRDFDLVGFAALGNVAAGAGFAAVKVNLDIRFAQF